jgi:hypothetical protein
VAVSVAVDVAVGVAVGVAVSAAHGVGEGGGGSAACGDGSGRLMVPVSTKGASTWLSAQQSASPLVWRWA